MEVIKTAETLIKDTTAVAKNIGHFVVGRMIGGAWAEIGRLAPPHTPHNIIRGEE